MRERERTEQTFVDCDTNLTLVDAERGRSELLGTSRAQPAAIVSDKSKETPVEQSARKVAIALEPDVLCKMFGVPDARVATRLLSQLVDILRPNPDKHVDAEVINQALALIVGIKPADTIEAMTATLLVGAQHTAHDSMRRALHPAQTPAGRALYGALALKAMRTYAQLLDALNHGRGKGLTTQKIIVERVSVEAGGQAVVGPIQVSRGGG